MERKRRGYAFTTNEKSLVRKTFGGNCSFDDCTRPNTGRVNHITGVFEGRLKGVPRNVVNDYTQNATMECKLHEAMHDIQEQEQVTIYARRK